MGSVCCPLKDDSSTVRASSTEEQGDSEEYSFKSYFGSSSMTYSHPFTNRLNDSDKYSLEEDLKSSSYTETDRLLWARQQSENPGDVEFFSTSINLIDFNIIALVGKGSFSKVHLVQKKDNGQYYAMKELKKISLINERKKSRVLTEKKIFLQFNNPFIVKMYYAFQTVDKIYFILDFVNGGELYSHMVKESRFSETKTKFYAAEMVIALKTLHEAGVIYRDLKPNNVLLDSQGHIKLIDFGLSKFLEPNKEPTTSVVGTPNYIAPEILVQSEHTHMIDWWSFGVILYEMISGAPPFLDRNCFTHKDIYKNILNKKIFMSRKFSKDAKDLVSKLLRRDPKRRLGIKGVHEIMNHPFFKEVDWVKIAIKGYVPPYIPDLNGETDLANISQSYIEENYNEESGNIRMTDAEKEERYLEELSYRHSKDSIDY
ncbi:unnamed protein product [Moneuplotes crassus]|uniref:Uncharacterized protein n=2 Tax=Euplotes crassus TaxID=5936 RepID=A0AAD1UN35_EUPCR|nr:unnamed protein product [Moneuplotes crassus]